MLCISKVAVCAEDAERNRQVEARALFAHVRRSEIDRRLVKRKEEAAV